MFVHIADERDRARIRRAGIVPSRARASGLWGVFCMPVLPNYFLSYQWLRELKRRGARTMVGIHFRVSDGEPVLVGHYGREPLPTTAAAAVRVILDAADARGFQVVLPRKVLPEEIHATRMINRVVGWRYYPDAHGHRPCGCPACLGRGQIKSRKLREAFEAALRGPDSG